MKGNEGDIGDENINRNTPFSTVYTVSINTAKMIIKKTKNSHKV